MPDKRIASLAAALLLLAGAGLFRPEGMAGSLLVLAMGLVSAFFLVLTWRFFLVLSKNRQEEPVITKGQAGTVPGLALADQADAAAARSAADEACIAEIRSLGTALHADAAALVETVKDAQSLETEVENACRTQKSALSSIRQGSDLIHQNSTQANAIAENMAANAEKASSLSGQVQDRVDLLAADLETSLSQVQYLLEESKKINSILEIMNQIASSTHVLGINASIVAARAGHQGQAFDVVAREIRKLAENTAASLNDIDVLIKHIQDTIAQVAEKNQKTSESILGEKATLLEVGGALQGVILCVEVIRTMTGVTAETALGLQNQVDTASSSAETRLSQLQFKGLEEKLENSVVNMRRLMEHIDKL